MQIQHMRVDWWNHQSLGGILMQWIMKPTALDALMVANDLRPADALEVMLSHGVSPHQAVRSSWSESDLCRGIADTNGRPVGLCGVVDHRIWMLATPGLTATKNGRRQLIVEGRKWVDDCIKELGPPLFNQVYSKNSRSIRWLKSLGFSVGKPHQHGPSGALFCDFWRFR